MKLVKSLLIGSVAGLAATAGAQAADLPFRKAAPVEYVRVCDWTGAGYFYIPGTDTCLKIGGMIRAEFAAQSNSRVGFTDGNVVNSRARDTTGFYVRARIDADARTQTAYGLLRTYVRFDLYDRSGVNDTAFFGRISGGGPLVAGQQSVPTIDKGYIQFAGITAGRAQSMFDFYADNYNYEGIANSDESTQMFAYTATFGGGFSATVSVEDPTTRRDGLGVLGAIANAGGVTIGAPIYGGSEIPDLVGVLRLDQAWGAAQLSGAYHQVNTVSGAGPAFSSATADGWAVQGGVDIKLPMLAAGDELWLQGAYQQGAFLYQDSSYGLNGGFYGIAVGGFQHPTVDAVAVTNANGTGYNLHLGEGYSVAGALHHYFTPQFHDVLFGSYEHISYGSLVNNTAWNAGGVGDASEYRIGNQFIFTPVHNLDIGLEFMYAHIDQHIAGTTGRGATANAAEAAYERTFGANGVARNPDAFIGRLHIERDF